MARVLTINTKEFDRNIKRLIKGIDRKVGFPAVDNTAKIIVRDAKRITPVDTGELRNSLTHETDVEAGTIEAVMGTDVDHSLIVHEDLNAMHTNGQAKFLEKATLKNIGTFKKQITSNFRKLR